VGKPKGNSSQTTHFWWLAPYSAVLAADAVPRCQLGGDEDAVAMSGSRLGWTTWLGGGPPHDRGDAMFAVG
jgi:predicted component of type VI protein secretion system